MSPYRRLAVPRHRPPDDPARRDDLRRRRRRDSTGQLIDPTGQLRCSISDTRRSAHAPNHLLQTPDTFVRAPLPGMREATAIVHVSPAGGAAFTQYTAEFEAGGELAPAARSAIRLRARGRGDRSTAARSAPATSPTCRRATPRVVSATAAARAAVIEKPYEPLAGARRPAGVRRPRARRRRRRCLQRRPVARSARPRFPTTRRSTSA